MIRVIILLGSALFSPLFVAHATEPVRVDYMLNCQGCHLPDGMGFPQRDVPTIKNHLGKFLHVEGGRAFLIRVPGAAQSDLTDMRLTNVINWMLTTFSPDELPENFSPYTSEEVSALRAAPLINVKATRAELIEKIKQLEER